MPQKKFSFFLEVYPSNKGTFLGHTLHFKVTFFLAACLVFHKISALNLVSKKNQNIERISAREFDLIGNKKLEKIVIYLQPITFRNVV